MNDRIREGVERYYTDKVRTYGNTSRGVDWNSTGSQHQRFHELCKAFTHEIPVDVLDYGCGYGELLKYLDEHFNGRIGRYQGYDLSEEMISRGRALFAGRSEATFTTDHPAPDSCDHALASGLFNVKLDLATAKEWEAYVMETIRSLDRISRKAFAFNALTKYSDRDRMNKELHYADPCILFDLCKREFSRNVALLHDYDLYEFTIIVRK